MDLLELLHLRSTYRRSDANGETFATGIPASILALEESSDRMLRRICNLVIVGFACYGIYRFLRWVFA